MSAEGHKRRGYQEGFSDLIPGVFDRESRERKAETMLRVLRAHLGERLADCRVLDVGASSGIIDAYLANHVGLVVGIDIDAKALAFARHQENASLGFTRADAMALPLADCSFDIVLCAHVYEHVPDAGRLLDEIERVLKPGGVCYFAAGNRFQLVEPHYRIPLLSAIPRPLAHWLIRRLAVADHYHELHFSLWGLKRLTARFQRHDYTLRLIRESEHFGTTYMVPSRGVKAWLLRLVSGVVYPLMPTYVWVLEKRSSPETTNPA